MKLQLNALRFHNWQGEVTRSLLWVVGCFVSLYSWYENWVNILNRKNEFYDWIGFLHPFSYDPLKAQTILLFPCVGWSWFLFFLWQNITFPFPFCWVVMAFVFPLAKHHIFFIFLPCWELKTEQKLFASKLKKYLTKSLSSSLPPSLPKRTWKPRMFLTCLCISYMLPILLVHQNI